MAIFESGHTDIELWTTVPPQEECTRFRIFYPTEHESVPRLIVDVMSALGAWRVWTGALSTAGLRSIASGVKSTSCGRRTTRSRTSFRSVSTGLTPSRRMAAAQ
jgi:hypothetical protein